MFRAFGNVFRTPGPVFSKGGCDAGFKWFDIHSIENYRFKISLRFHAAKLVVFRCSAPNG